MNLQEITEYGNYNIEDDENTAELYDDPKLNGFLKYTDRLLEQISFKKEAIRTGKKGEVELNEILTSFGSTNIQTALNAFKITNRTYELFLRVINYAFFEVTQTNKGHTLNLYLKDLGNPNFQSDIESLINTYDIDNSKIVFEILEDNYGELNQEVIDNLFFLRKKGFKIAIDDFMPYLTDENISNETLKNLLENNFIVDYVKIDGKYLQDILKGNKPEEEKELIGNIIKKLKSIGITTISEWIQSNQDGINAKKLGIDLFQGRYIDDDFTTDEIVRDFRVIDNSNSFKRVKTIKDTFNERRKKLERQKEVQSFKLTKKKITSFVLYTGNQVEDVLSC